MTHALTEQWEIKGELMVGGEERGGGLIHALIEHSGTKGEGREKGHDTCID